MKKISSYVEESRECQARKRTARDQWKYFELSPHPFTQMLSKNDVTIPAYFHRRQTRNFSSSGDVAAELSGVSRVTRHRMMTPLAWGEIFEESRTSVCAVTRDEVTATPQISNASLSEKRRILLDESWWRNSGIFFLFFSNRTLNCLWDRLRVRKHLAAKSDSILFAIPKTVSVQAIPPQQTKSLPRWRQHDSSLRNESSLFFFLYVLALRYSLQVRVRHLGGYVKRKQKK